MKLLCEIDHLNKTINNSNSEFVNKNKTFKVRQAQIN